MTSSWIGRLAAGLCLIALGLLGPAAAAQPAPLYRPLGLLIASKANGYDYAYAPVLIREGEGWRAVYCSTGHGVMAWDWIRTATSPDGVHWSEPEVLLTVTGGESERAACDPSLVRFQAKGDAAPFYYLFYSGAPNGTGTAMFVARASQIEGPYAKWTGSDWVVDAPNPQPIIRPSVPHADKTGFYGAGQQSVVVQGGKLRSWFIDDTTCAERCERIFTSTTDDPTRWSAPVGTNVGGSSVDVKYDPARRRFVMYLILGPHTFSSYLVRRDSADGVTWGRPEIVAGPTAFTHYANNVGIGGDDAGHLVPGDLLVAFGAPRGADCGNCWARWNLDGGIVARAEAAQR